MRKNHSFPRIEWNTPPSKQKEEESAGTLISLQLYCWLSALLTVYLNRVCPYYQLSALLTALPRQIEGVHIMECSVTVVWKISCKSKGPLLDIPRSNTTKMFFKACLRWMKKKSQRSESDTTSKRRGCMAPPSSAGVCSRNSCLLHQVTELEAGAVCCAWLLRREAKKYKSIIRESEVIWNGAQ